MYRSKLEKQVAKTMSHCRYEPWQLSYVVPHTYTPDFVDDTTNTVYEVKGFFRAGDTQKYLAIYDHMVAAGYNFVFILSHPNKPVRKGTKLTMSQWCDKHNIKWQQA